MAFNDCVHPALMLDEVLERILEYTASGEPFRTSCNLRLVCKQWQSMSFKGLCRSTSLPAIDLHPNNCTTDMEEILFKGSWQGVETSLEFFRKRLPKHIPAFIAISEPRLPIEIRLGQLPLPEDVAVIREFSRSVASLKIGKNSCNSDEEYGLNGNLEYDFKLPNLRSIMFSWKDITNFQPWQRLLTNILDISNSHVIFKYVNVGSNSSPPNDWPIAPPKVTHMQFTGLATDLERFVTPFKQLVELSLELYVSSGTAAVATAESFAITEILERKISTLQTVRMFSASRTFMRTLKLPTTQFLKLRALETNLPILLSKEESNSTSLPKIKELKYAIGYHPEEESDGFQVSHLVSKYLVKLDLCWIQLGTSDRDSCARTAQKQAKMARQILNKFAKEDFPPYPELLDLSIVKMPFRFGDAFVPRMANSMTNLSRLCLNLVEHCKSEGTSRAYAGDLVQILTGVAPRRIQKNPKFWPGLFKDKPATITNLKNLSELQIDSGVCVMGRFIFDVAFMKMEKLKILRLQGGVTAEDDMIEKWISGGREISVENRHCTREYLNLVFPLRPC